MGLLHPLKQQHIRVTTMAVQRAFCRAYSFSQVPEHYIEHELDKRLLDINALAAAILSTMGA
jgi:hypothetical protein